MNPVTAWWVIFGNHISQGLGACCKHAILVCPLSRSCHKVLPPTMRTEEHVVLRRLKLNFATMIAVGHLRMCCSSNRSQGESSGGILLSLLLLFGCFVWLRLKIGTVLYPEIPLLDHNFPLRCI